MNKYTQSIKKQRASVLAAAITTALLTTSVHAAEFKLGSTTVNVGGYIKLDTNYSKYSDGTPTNRRTNQFYIPSDTPVGGDSSSHFNMHAKQSRFNIKTSTDLANGKKLKGLLEMDFNPTGNSHELTTNREGVTLRHAVFTYGNWTFGQTWSNLLNTSSIAETLDFFALSEGMISTRQPLIKYTNGPISVSIENPETFLVGGGAGEDENSAPDLIGKYTHSGGFGNVSLAGIVRKLEGNDLSTTAGGLSLAGRIKAGGKDDVRFAITSGKGMGRYLGLALNRGAYVDGNSLETIDQTAANVGYRHFWGPKTRSTLGYAVYDTDDAGAAAGVYNKKSQSLHLNLIHSPTKKVSYGAELIMGKLDKSTGDSGDMNRIQFSAKYSF